ncbi:MAG: DUF721 domain-containing protein [Lentisphaeria bacterium]|nr:DUF721 domain-containing protein [Lentisphaeria bacterium]
MAETSRKPPEYMRSLLKDWYGKEQGEAEMSRYMPQPEPIGPALDKELKRLVPPWIRLVELVRENWPEIAGQDNARRCSPAFLNNGIFYIEVNHPAYRVALEMPKIKQTILERIQTIIGDKLCTEIKYIPAGRTLPRRPPCE